MLWTPHPVFAIPSREQAIALVQTHGPDEAQKRLREIWEKRE